MRRRYSAAEKEAAVQRVSAVSANVSPVFAIANRLRKPLVSLALPEHFTFSHFPQFPLSVFACRQRRVAGTASIPEVPARRHPICRERGVVVFEPSTRLTMATILLLGGRKPCAELK